MRVEKINEQEEIFKSTLKNSSNVKYTLDKTTPLDKFSIFHIRPSFDSYYYKEESKKNKIVLHFTVGTLRGDLASLTKKDQEMSVSYVIARNGSIYEVFDPKYWSYHLGKGAVGGNSLCSKESIGIELSNYGPLNLSGTNLETYYSTTDKKDVYCALTDTDAYDQIDTAFRGSKYFASFTENQYEALDELLNHLSKEFNIPKTLLPESTRYSTFASTQLAKDYKGICTHVNFRTSGKWDIGPSFKWDKISGKKAEVKKPEVVAEKKVEAVKPVELKPVELKPVETKVVEVPKPVEVKPVEVVKPAVKVEQPKVEQSKPVVQPKPVAPIASESTTGGSLLSKIPFKLDKETVMKGVNFLFGMFTKK